MPKKTERLALVIDTASYERVTFALGMASASAVIGNDVSVLFGHGGVIRLKKGSTDQIGAETASWIRGKMKAGVESGTIAPVSELLSVLKRAGGKIYACPTAMDLHNITINELVPEVDEVRSLVRFVMEDFKGASIMYV